uniref:Uncharacterized protein n=1 Tax=Trichogramma kaykai TaxID=54128 RepID=A0ABD2XMI4_9HYME
MYTDSWWKSASAYISVHTSTRHAGINIPSLELVRHRVYAYMYTRSHTYMCVPVRLHIYTEPSRNYAHGCSLLMVVSRWRWWRRKRLGTSFSTLFGNARDSLLSLIMRASRGKAGP